MAPHDILAEGDGVGGGMALSGGGRTLLHLRQTGAADGERRELVRLDLEKGTSETLTSHGSRLFGPVVMDPTESLVVTGDLDGVVRVGPNIFVNGVLQDSVSIAGDALVANSASHSMGAMGGAAFRVPLDVVRIATAGRSSAWVQTEYNNQNDPAGFFNVCGPTTEVELQSFEARGVDGAVELVWKTVSELNNLGFHLYRSTAASGAYERVTASLIPGLGSSPVGAEYSYRDTGVENGVTYFYELEDVETTGATGRHGPVSATPGTAESALLRRLAHRHSRSREPRAADRRTQRVRGDYLATEYLVNAPPAWLSEFGPSAAYTFPSASTATPSPAVP